MDSIRSIVVHVDGSPSAEGRLRVGLALAQAARGRLTALYAAMPAAYEVPLALTPEAGAYLATALQDIDRQRFERARATFDRVSAGAGTPAPVWEDAGTAPVHAAVAARALTADLMLFGPHEPDEWPRGGQADLVASTLISSGTPALLLPGGGTFDTEALASAAPTVLLAWKPTREASHAARAALPWLRRARQVHLATEGPGEADAPGAAALREWLLLQGVKAGVREHAVGPGQAGEHLLSLAAEVSADLLVMGCYGHSRARELVLGGASRTVLAAPTLPLLMAH
jgi:nucleotide-binding universal stress UspA family protein